MAYAGHLWLFEDGYSQVDDLVFYEMDKVA